MGHLEGLVGWLDERERDIAYQMETTTCNLCHSPHAEVVYRISDWLLNRPEVVTTLVRCKECGLIYQNPRPTIEEMGEHYPPDYEPYHSYETEKKSWLMQKAIDYGFDNRARGVIDYKKDGLLLDLGCAAGDFLIHMQKKYGWQVRGVEISKYASTIAREKFGLDVFTGNLETANFPDNTFDAVTLWDVLEHLHDPSGTLHEVQRVLKPGGILAFRVPNGNSYDARIFGRYWSGLDAPRHLYIFDPSSLRALLTKNGFQVLRMTSKHGSYLGFALSIRMWMVAKGVNPSTRDALTIAMYHPLARMASVPAFYLYSLMQHSSQLMVSARALK